jgi:uncharacterized protein
MTGTTKPEPRKDGLNGEFYAHCAAGELRFQRCEDCGSWRHMPRYACAHCGSGRWRWALSSGRGKVYSWTVAHRAFHPAFEAELPYAVAIIEMSEGVRLVSQVVDVAYNELRLDMSVAVVFEALPTGTMLPKFKLA